MPKFQEIEISLIDCSGQQIREDPNDDGIVELANSIAKKGLLQPIGVTPKEGGGFRLLWGSRRILAHKRLGRGKILASIREATEEPDKSVALVENIQRQDMSMEEQIDAVVHLHEVEKLSVESICDFLSKSRSWVVRRLSVREMPEFLRAEVLDGRLPVGHAEEIWRVPEEGAQRYLVATAISARWNFATVREVVANTIAQIEGREPRQPVGPGEKETLTAPPPLYACEACGRTAEIAEFRLVRVCASGCPGSTAVDRVTLGVNSKGGRHVE